MMLKKLFQSALGSALLLLFCGAGHTWAQSTPAFWRVESPTTTVWLLGSMHFGTPTFYPLPAQVEQAFAAADILAVEVDITRIQPSEALSAITRHGRLKGGESLSTVLSPDTLKRLRGHLQKTSVPFDSLARFKPWFAALQLVEAEIRRTEYEPAYGIDQFFLRKAKGKDVVELETLDSQLGIFSALSLSEQEQFLDQTLVDISASEGYLREMADAWQSGNLQLLESSLLKPFADNPDTQKLYQAIFTERNLQMAEQAVQWLEGDRSVFLVVGAGHMIGDGGIVALLQNRGFVSTRLPFIAASTKPAVSANELLSINALR